MANFVPLNNDPAIPRIALQKPGFSVPFSNLYDALIRGERQQLL